MSQYPSPYSPPSYTPTYGMFPDVLAPSRRAGTLLIVLGALMLIYAMCNGASSALLSGEEMRQFQQELSSAAGESPFSAETMLKATLVFSGVVMLFSVLFIFCGILTRRGNGPATMGGMILNSIFLVGAVLFLVATLIISLAMPVMLLGACIMLAATSLFALSEYWLFQAMKVPAQIAIMQQQYQMQMWQYQQQAQGYATGEYPQGYGQPPGANPAPQSSLGSHDAKGPQA